MSWLQNVMSGNSAIKSELEELAQRCRDETLPARERLNAMMELGMAVKAGEQLQEMFDSLDEECEETEPEYRWVNGARVKV